MKRTVYIFYIVVVAMIAGCAGCGDTKELAAGDSGHEDFERRMSEADSLYNGMQFRDAYDL